MAKGLVDGRACGWTVALHVCAHAQGCQAAGRMSPARCPALLTPAHRLAVTQSLAGTAFIFGFISISAASGGWVGAWVSPALPANLHPAATGFIVEPKIQKSPRQTQPQPRCGSNPRFLSVPVWPPSLLSDCLVSISLSLELLPLQSSAGSPRGLCREESQPYHSFVFPSPPLTCSNGRQHTRDENSAV